MQTLYRGSDISGERSVTISPLNWSPIKSPVLYVHGAGDFADTWMSIPTRVPLFSSLARAGYPLVSHDNGGAQTWGNDTAMSRMTSAYNQIFPQGGKISLLSQSMGGLNSILWAARNPEKVACMVLIMPVIDLGEVHATPGGYSGLIDAALGVSYSDQAHGLARSPIIMARTGTHPKIPTQIWYGDSDTLCRPGKAEEYGALSSASLFKIPGGHAEQTVSGVNPSTVVSFINQYNI